MLARALSAYVIGIDAHLIEVEVDIAARGLPHFSMVGLPDAAMKESRDRIKAALKNIGFNFPLKQITINLAPADMKKEGSSFDLPIAVGIVAAEGIIPANPLSDYIIAGELSLDGRVKPVKGALSIALEAKKKGVKGVILPKENVAEAAVVAGIEVYGMKASRT
jgi:magnesium chelatase family protein